MKHSIFGPVTVMDDRGTEVPLFDVLHTRGAEEQEAAVAAVKASETSMEPRLTLRGVWTMFGWLVVPFVLLFGAFGMVSASWSNPFLKGGAFAVAGVLGATWMMRVARRRGAMRVRAALLKIGRCASCGYSLEGLKVEPDGCVVCAECGRAWRRTLTDTAENRKPL